MAIRSNGGHIAGEDISAYVDEELSSGDAARVAAHLQTCDECRSLADDMRATQTLVRELPLVRAPRDFTLGPEFDVAPSRQTYGAPKRGWFNFMPAVAMSAALLLILVFADLSTLSRSNDSSSAGSSSAGRSLEDAAKAASEAAPQPAQAQPVAPRQSQPVPGSGGANTQGFGPTPAAQAAGGAPATAPQPPTRVPLSAAAPGTPTSTGALAPPPAVDTTTSRAPTPTSYAVIVGADESGSDKDDGGIGTLRIVEIVTAVVLAGSLVGLYLQKRRA